MRTPAELESAVVIADRALTSDPLAGLRPTSLAVWKRRPLRASTGATLLLPLESADARSWEAAEAVLRRLHRVKKPPTVYLHFRNALSAGVWVARLAGSEVDAGLSEPEVTDWLQGLGWSVVERREIAMPQGPEAEIGLAQATSRALVDLFRQLNPNAASDYWLWRVEHGPAGREERSSPTRVPRRLSLLLDLSPPFRLDELDRTLFAMGCQQHPAVEWVVHGPRESAEARALLAHHRKLSGVTCLVRSSDLNNAIENATGQYLAFAAPGLVVYPEHYARQIDRISASDRAWSWATARQVALSLDAAGSLHVATKRTVPGDERLEPLAFARERVALYAAVMDRNRLGAFRLALEPGESATQLLWRLSALFEPLFAPGLPELELRGEQPIEAAQPKGGVLLRSIEDWSRTLELAREQVRGSGVRRQFVDQLNAEIKHRLPYLHDQLKRLARRWLD